MIAAFPLQWPIGQQRTVTGRRQPSRFKLSLTSSRDDLLRELDLLGAKDVVISSNLELRRDGLPYADSREPQDPGIAVYFERNKKPFVIACDTYTKATHNLRAVGVTVEALRTIQRHGASSMLEQAFTGFAALPAAGEKKKWWEVLGVPERATTNEVRSAYFDLSQIHHPDRGGSRERMAEINDAFRASKGVT
jgi:hypothetical protein